MQGVYNCTMSAAILTMVFHSVQAIQVSVTYSAPVCLLQGFYVALVYHSVTYCQVCARTLSGLCFSELKPSACQVCARTLSGLWFSVPSKLSFQHVRRSGLPPWEAPIMTAEKRKLSSSFSFLFNMCIIMSPLEPPAMLKADS